MASTQLREIASALGLGRRSSGGTFYGEIDGFAAQVSLVQKGNYKHLAAVLRFNTDADSVGITVLPRLFGLPAADVVAARVRAALEALKRAVPDNRKVCRECGAASAEPALLRGKVDRVCGACAERLEQEAVEVQKAYAARALNLPLGLAASLVAGAAGAVVYGGAMIATDKMYNTVNWMAFVKHSPQLLWASGRDTVFSLAGGLLGAFYAIRKATPPSFTVVEKAPEVGIQA